MRGTPVERFFAKFNEDDRTGCWLWAGAVTGNGYATLDIDRRTRLAHRWYWEHVNGPVPEGLHLDHLCRTRHCVNPDHLEPVAPAENVRRGRKVERERTHCPQGHPYSGDNLKIDARGHRKCRTCNRERNRQRRKVSA